MRIVDLTLESIAFGGKGVARDNGKAVFVPYTIDGEKISAKIVREKKQFAEAEVVDLKETSPHRVTPPCPYFGRCGGCAYQHISYAHQLTIKSQQVADVLKRIGKIENPPLRSIVPSPDQYDYRNRITVHARDGMIGFFRRDSHDLIDVERCPIAMDEVNNTLADLRRDQVRDGHYTLRAQTGARVFSQTNNAVADLLRDWIVDLVQPNQKLLIDLYCGAGFFTKALLDRFERVIGIDWDRFAISEAKKTATAKENYIAGDVNDELGVSLPGNKSIQPTTIIVDPPASGLTGNIRQTILDLAPKTLIYISCNPPTLARDLKDLKERFTIESVTPFDMFPQTAEIEVAVHLHHSPD